MDKQTQYWDGPAWAITHRNSEDFLGILLPLPSPHLSFCPPGPRLSLWGTLNHCEEEWKFKGLPLGLLQSSLGRILYGGVERNSDSAQGATREKQQLVWVLFFFF